MRVTNNPEEIGNCGCGRSPTGKCIGWHGLNEQQLKEAKAAWTEALTQRSAAQITVDEVKQGPNQANP